MKKKTLTGYVIALQGAGLMGTFALLSGIRLLDFLGHYFIGLMVVGLILALVGLYLAAGFEEN